MPADKQTQHPPPTITNSTQPLPAPQTTQSTSHTRDRSTHRARRRPAFGSARRRVVGFTSIGKLEPPPAAPDRYDYYYYCHRDKQASKPGAAQPEEPGLSTRSRTDRSRPDCPPPSIMTIPLALAAGRLRAGHIRGGGGGDHLNDGNAPAAQGAAADEDSPSPSSSPSGGSTSSKCMCAPTHDSRGVSNQPADSGLDS